MPTRFTLLEPSPIPSLATPGLSHPTPEQDVSERPLGDGKSDGLLVHLFVADFYEAFNRDSREASGFFSEPASFLGNGAIVPLATCAAAASYLLEWRRALTKRGWVRSERTHGSLKMLSPSASLYSSVSVQLREDGTVIDQTGFTYLLFKGLLGWAIFSVVATDTESAAKAERDGGATIVS